MSTTINNPMMDAIRSVPSHFEMGLRAAQGLGAVYRDRVHSQVIVCGMGGSAFPGDMLATALAGRGPTVSVSRDYSVTAPSCSESPLVIISSFSGNTEEALGSYQDAKSAGAAVAVVTSGGQLAERARADGLPCCLLQKPFPDFQPRAAGGMFVGAFLKLINDAGLCPSGDLIEDELRSTGAALADAASHAEGLGRKMASALGDRTPVIYGSAPYTLSIARIAKIKFNENSKCPAFYNEFPELNHNEMVGFTRMADRFQLLVIVDDDAPIRCQTRVRKTIETLTEYGVSVVELPLVGKTPAERTFRAIQVFDYMSIFCAMDAGVDPNPVHMVEDFKGRLGPYQP
jgi:glucose/mannose-6-phosphate isomerase